MSHCPGCRGYTEEDDANGDVYEADCPGVTCPTCAEREREKAKWGVYPCEQCAAKNTEIARLTALVAVGREMADALAKWKVARLSAVEGFKEREPGIMQDFMGAASALLQQSIALDEASTACEKWRSLEGE